MARGDKVKGTSAKLFKRVHQQFEAQVERDRTAPAVVYGGHTLSYGNLNERSNQLAHHLISLGVTAETRVAICLERSLEMIVGLLAVLKAGGAYVPLDPSYPAERLGYMIQDSSPLLILTCEDAAAKLRDALGLVADANVPVLDLTLDAHAWKEQPSHNPTSDDLSQKDLAYVIYTSGSTGSPKGVMVEHRNLSSLFEAAQDKFHFDHSDIWSLFHSFSFDFSVWETWGALIHGGKVIVVPHGTSRSPRDFYQLICDEKVTVLSQTPSAFRSFVDQQNSCEKRHRLRYVIFGGEAIQFGTLGAWYQNDKTRQTQLVNMYGTTETTVVMTYRLLDAADISDQVTGSPIGRPISNARIYLLDKLGSPVPSGAPGEIYIGGACVARGYLDRPELTAERFLPNPFLAEDRLYRTGDLAKYLPDGSIEFIGRNDYQVKMRGFRVELGEIEAQLRRHPQILEAVVIVKDDSNGGKKLIAYYTTDTSKHIAAQELRSHLVRSLPDYMIPAGYMLLEALPLTPNGKLDQKALPIPDGEEFVRKPYVAPVGHIEVAIARIWSDVLGVDRVGRHDDFFDLGGHSLLALQIVNRILDELDAEVPLVALFRAPSFLEYCQSVGPTLEMKSVGAQVL